VKDEAFNSWLIGRTPSRRRGDVKDLVGAVVFVGSDASRRAGRVVSLDGSVRSS
jgi:gluconate 5-dehydrogenase